MRTLLSFALAAALFADARLAAQTINPALLDSGTRVDQWWPGSQDELEDIAADPNLAVRFSQVLRGAESQINGLIGGPIGDCSSVGGPVSSVGRACLFVANLERYRDFLDRDQQCRIRPRLEAISDVTEPVDDVERDIISFNNNVPGPLAALDLFTPSQIPLAGAAPFTDVFPLFEAASIPEQCAGVGDLNLDPIEVPAESTADTDKLILGYAFVLSLMNWEFNRPYAVATAEAIAAANQRWSNFERNVIQDQYPWETLVFNDWLARGSSRFTGTLMNPPDVQLRVLHPVPTALVDTDGDESLFRPRLAVEVVGYRKLDANDEYRAKRGVSLLAVLKADDDESAGWGVLVTFRRGSLGVVSQEIGDDDVVSVVFGVDLANQMDSKRNELMERWAAFRMQLETLGN